MKVETIFENSSVELSEEYSQKVKVVIDKNPFLPIRLRDQTLHFSDYTIGEFRIGNLCINIKPRNEAFTLADYFQIIQFLDRPLLNDVDGYGFESTGPLFNVADISRQFCSICTKLLQFGLTGDYLSECNYEKSVSGSIVFDQFRAKLIPYDGIPVEVSTFELDTPENQIIRAALSKLIEIEKLNKNSEKYQILRDFDYVSDVVFDEYEVETVIANFYSSNPYYLPALELSRKILFRLELEYKDGGIEWLAFLENSNLIFENYINAILKLHLKEKVAKWDKPKPYAKLNHINNYVEKSYSPDVLINYDNKSASAAVVLDVKNKLFEPSSSSSISELVSSSDLYQLMFYCRQLKTCLGGLVYPSTTTNSPIRITFDIDDALQLYLFSINMKASMKERHRQLTEDITRYVLAKT